MLLEESCPSNVTRVTFQLVVIKSILFNEMNIFILYSILVFHGFRRGRSTMDPVFALKILQEKYKEKQKDLHIIFVDLEKAYDGVPRDLIWWAMRKRAIPEGYVNVQRN